MELVTRVTSSTAASTAVTGEHIIDVRETGGMERSQMIVTAPAAAQPLQLEVTGSDVRDGTYAKVLSWKTTADADFEYRDRLPLDCPRYLKLAVTTGATAPAAAVQITLRIAC